MRQYKRYITVLEATEIYKKFKIKKVAIYSSGFNGGIMRKTGMFSYAKIISKIYLGTNFMAYTINTCIF